MISCFLSGLFFLFVLFRLDLLFQKIFLGLDFFKVPFKIVEIFEITLRAPTFRTLEDFSRYFQNTSSRKKNRETIMRRRQVKRVTVDEDGLGEVNTLSFYFFFTFFKKLYLKWKFDVLDRFILFCCFIQNAHIQHITFKNTTINRPSYIVSVTVCVYYVV